MEFIVPIILYLYLFWMFYVLIMGLYRAYLSKRLVGLNKYLAAPCLLIGLILDVVANIFFATFIFMELPKEWLVTSRLMRYQTYDHGYRKKLAQYICDNVLDPFDPTGNHC